MPVKTDPFDVGDDVVIYADFVDETGAAATPAAGTFTLKQPNGTETATDFSALVNPSTGRLEKTHLVVVAGTHYFKFAATAPTHIVRQGYFRVRRDSTA